MWHGKKPGLELIVHSVMLGLFVIGLRQEKGMIFPLKVET